MKHEKTLAILTVMICIGFIGFKLTNMSFISDLTKISPLTGAFTFVSQNPLIAGGGLIIVLILSSIIWILKGGKEKKVAKWETNEIPYKKVEPKKETLVISTNTVSPRETFLKRQEEIRNGK